MKTITGCRCIDCGEVTLFASDVKVVVCMTNDRASYSFLCPQCNLLTTRETESRVVDLLVAAGCSLITWSMPDELQEVSTEAKLTYDDLIDFHFGDWDDAMYELQSW